MAVKAPLSRRTPNLRSLAGLVDLSRTDLFMSSRSVAEAKNLTARPFAEFILSVAEGLRVTDLVCQPFVVRFSGAPQ